MKLQLVEDWRKAWKWFSVHAMALAAALIGGYLEAPAEFKAAIPQEWVSKISIALLILGIVLRVLKQEPKANDAANK